MGNLLPLLAALHSSADAPVLRIDPLLLAISNLRPWLALELAAPRPALEREARCSSAR